jgi:hypothetical protein
VQNNRLPRRCRNETGYYTFHRRDFSPAQVKETAKLRDEVFKLLARKYHFTFGFFDGISPPFTPGDGDPYLGALDGLTVWKEFKKQHYIFTFLSLKMLEPLIIHRQFDRLRTNGAAVVYSSHNSA